jgi:hypothetical protein
MTATAKDIVTTIASHRYLVAMLAVDAAKENKTATKAAMNAAKAASDAAFATRDSSADALAEYVYLNARYNVAEAMFKAACRVVDLAEIDLRDAWLDCQDARAA